MHSLIPFFLFVLHIYTDPLYSNQIILLAVANESSKFLPNFKEAAKSFKGKVILSVDLSNIFMNFFSCLFPCIVLYWNSCIQLIVSCPCTRCYYYYCWHAFFYYSLMNGVTRVQLLFFFLEQDSEEGKQAAKLLYIPCTGQETTVIPHFVCLLCFKIGFLHGNSIHHWLWFHSKEWSLNPRIRSEYVEIGIWQSICLIVIAITLFMVLSSLFFFLLLGYISIPP